MRLTVGRRNLKAACVKATAHCFDKFYSETMNAAKINENYEFEDADKGSESSLLKGFVPWKKNSVLRGNEKGVLGAGLPPIAGSSS